MLDREKSGSFDSGNMEDKTPCWRRLFIANELCKLFTTRYTTIEITLFLYIILN